MSGKPDLGALTERALKVVRPRLKKLYGPQDPNSFTLIQTKTDFVRLEFTAEDMNNVIKKGNVWRTIANRVRGERGIACVFMSSIFFIDKDRLEHIESEEERERVAQEERRLYNGRLGSHPDAMEALMFYALAPNDRLITLYELERTPAGAPTLKPGRKVDKDDIGGDDIEGIAAAFGSF